VSGGCRWPFVNEEDGYDASVFWGREYDVRMILVANGVGINRSPFFFFFF